MHDLWNDREVRALLETDACVGATYVDAIDRTQEDRTFPWRLPGHIVNDPYVRRRGNERLPTIIVPIGYQKQVKLPSLEELAWHLSCSFLGQ